ncbi:histidine kinase [Nesterenkonia sp. NBAIMH1]|uniref:sensor histidine kinase n=1 Tax=Nesterenkonia sp. NBAIMH1 TaxID=2600320 RepID=UPI0011B4672C
MEQASATTVILVVIIAVLTALVLYVAARGRGAAPSADDAAAVEPTPDDAVDYRALAEATRRQLVEAELRTLRSQISPHFIYNSLNAIAATIPADPVKARELVIDFADFTRYSLRGAGDFTTLEEELAAVERYVLLEQARFEDRVQVRLKIAPEVLSLKIPFLAVQPLVENAVRHGMDSVTGHAKVRLTGQDEGTHAVISVEDDGPGADPEQIRRVLVGEEGSTHIGLRNVDLRLRQAYGGADGLQIETAEGAGMRVWMRVPKFQPGAEETV